MPLLIVLSFIYSAGTLVKVGVWHMYTHVMRIVCAGAGVGKRDEDAWVNEDDGVIQLDTVAHLVPQAIPFPHDWGCYHGYIDQGQLICTCVNQIWQNYPCERTN